MFSAGDFKKCSGCTAAGIMRQLNARKTVLLVCTDLDNGRRCVPGIESTYKQFFEWYLTGVHFFNECRKINAKYELFVTDRADGFCDGLETGFAEFYFDKYYRKDKNR